MIDPNEEVMHQDKLPDDIQNVLNLFSEKTRDLASIGTHFIKWHNSKDDNSTADVVLIMMLRNVASILSAGAALIKNSSIDPCSLLIRSLLETYFSIKFLLKEDSERRALSFVVCYYHEKLAFLEKHNPEEEVFLKHMQSLLNDEQPFYFKPIGNIKSETDSIKRHLQQELFADVEKEYQYFKKKNPYNITWYKLFKGPKNLIELTKQVGEYKMYTYYYSPLSRSVHGTDFDLLEKTSIDTGFIPAVNDITNVQKKVIDFFNCGLLIYTYVTKKYPIYKYDYTKFYNELKPFIHSIHQKDYITFNK